MQNSMEHPMFFYFNIKWNIYWIQLKNSDEKMLNSRKNLAPAH